MSGLQHGMPPHGTEIDDLGGDAAEREDAGDTCS
jgi:hypothetical protein